MMNHSIPGALWAVVLLLTLFADSVRADRPEQFSDQEIALLLANFATESPPRPSSKISGIPKAIDLGERLFFSPVLSRNRDMSCATCHQPDADWTDNLPIAENGKRNTPTLWNVANQRWFFWDGRADSLWSQSLHVIEGESEFDLFRTRVAKRILSDPDLNARYQSVFGTVDIADHMIAIPTCETPAACKQLWAELTPELKQEVNRLFVNIGKSYAAYVETLQAPPSRFDELIEALEREQPETVTLSASEKRGLKLFIGKGRCHICHHGSDLTDGEFHDVRVKPRSGPVEKGRHAGVASVLGSEFNMLTDFNDFPKNAQHTAYLSPQPDDWGKFKTPTLRRVAFTAPYMHAGQYETLEEVVNHYSTFKNALPPGHHGEMLLVPLHLSDQEIEDLIKALELF